MRWEPKELKAEPLLFEQASDGATTSFAARGTHGQPSAPTGDEGIPTAGNGEASSPELLTLEDVRGTDSEALRLALRIAARLAVPAPRRGARTQGRGAGSPRSVPYTGASDEIDLDLTTERILEQPVYDESDIFVREPTRHRRTVVLAIDVSGSMQGARLVTSAATVGAMVREMQHDRLGVIAFWRDALVLTKLGQRILIPSLVETTLRIPVRGLTNIHFGLDVARHELARLWSREPRVILLSDCLHSAGPDPRLLAPAVPRLDVILDTSGEHDPELAADLAWLGRGKLACVRAYEDVPPAIADLFA